MAVGIGEDLGLHINHVKARRSPAHCEIFQAFAGCILSFIAITAFAQSPQEQEVWNDVDALNAAVFVSKDAAVMSRLVSDKLSYGHSSGVLENKTEMVANAASNNTTYRAIVVEKLRINVTDNTATARHIFNATQTDK